MNALCRCHKRPASLLRYRLNASTATLPGQQAFVFGRTSLQSGDADESYRDSMLNVEKEKLNYARHGKAISRLPFNVALADRLNPRPSGEVKVRHAGPSIGLRINSRRHPGSFSVHDQEPPGFPASAGMTATRVDFQSTNPESLGLVVGISRSRCATNGRRRIFSCRKSGHRWMISPIAGPRTLRSLRPWLLARNPRIRYFTTKVNVIFPRS